MSRRHHRSSATVATVVCAALLAACTGGGEVDGDPAGSAAPVTSDAEGEAERLAEEEAEAERLAEEEAEAERLAEEEAEAARIAEEEAEAERLAEEEAEAERQAEEERLAAEEAEREAEEEARRKAEEEQQQLVDAQERLIELGYLLGSADGEKGQQTTSAIMAFQAVNGIAVDGVLGPQTIETLASPNREPSLRGGPSNRIEVDMDLQVLHVVEGDQRVTTMKTSTGRGGTFESTNGTLRAETPVGTFTIERRIQGEHSSTLGLGTMYDPLYFHGPWAIHGSGDVPAGPASSGCVRIAMANGRWLFDRVPNGTAVVLYGGVHTFTV